MVIANVRGIGVAVIRRISGVRRSASPRSAQYDGALQNAETGAVVDHPEAEGRHAHVVLNQRVRTDRQLNVAIGKARVELVRANGVVSGQQRNPHTKRRREWLEGAEMLRGEQLGGRHECHLLAVLDRCQRRKQRDDGLAAAHVTLHQPVHGVGRAMSAYICSMTRCCAPVSANGRSVAADR